jgi:hypothetical protein
MESYIHKYLTRHYELSTTEESSKKLTLIVTYGIYYREDSKVKSEIENYRLLKELGDVFGITEAKAKAYVNNWAKSITKKADLKPYWEKVSQLLPMAVRVMAKTLALDLVAVQPMDVPTGLLTFMDFNYSGETPNRNGRVYHQEVVEINEERVKQSWAPILEGQVPSWQIEKLTKLMENQKIFASSRKKEE